MSSAHTPRIVVEGRTAWRTANAESAGVIVDAADYYRAFYAAALEAQHSILLSGWQFDSGVQLLRGEDAGEHREVRLLKFLNQLCEARPSLEIYVLAWDFHLVFALEREWMQTLMFHWMTNERLHFRFDQTATAGGSHHQKFAVIDRRLAFIGGIDLCEARWDDRRHLAENPLRTSHGDPVKPYHDVQAYCTGCEVTDVFRDLFVDRWARTHGPALELQPCDPSANCDYRPEGAIPFPPGALALSRTDPKQEAESVHEVQKLFIDAIAAAERLVYIETQYFSARSIRDALIRRMHDQARPKLEIVLIVNQKAEALKEELAIGLRQTNNLERLRKAASETGHALGVYYSLCEGDDPKRLATYIHSKLMAVDDRFLTVGSANLTNRSMAVDTELHVSWETLAPGDEGAELSKAIRFLRTDLLREHAGLGEGERASLEEPSGLVAKLDALTARPNARLQKLPPPPEDKREMLEIIDADELPFDPAKPNYDFASELADEQEAVGAVFTRGISALFERLKLGKK